LRVLVVEDDPKLGKLILRGLERGGFASGLADNVERPLWMGGSTADDAIRRPETRTHPRGPGV